MKVDTIKGSSYVMTCTKACTVHAVLSSSVDLMLVLEAGKAGQYGFVAPTDAVEISDENAFVIQIFKTPVPRLFVQDGVQPGEDAILKNMMAESGTFAGTVNANGGVRVPLPATAQEALSWDSMLDRASWCAAPPMPPFRHGWHCWRACNPSAFTSIPAPMHPSRKASLKMNYMTMSLE